MKGVFFLLECVVCRVVLNLFFLDIIYFCEFGGILDEIMDLIYQGLFDFYMKYYYFLNSYIYLYGDMDMEEKLKWLDEIYLNQYDCIEMDLEIGVQEVFSEWVDVVKIYFVGSIELEVDNSFLMYNVVIGIMFDQELNIVF